MVTQAPIKVVTEGDIGKGLAISADKKLMVDIEATAPLKIDDQGKVTIDQAKLTSAFKGSEVQDLSGNRLGFLLTSE